MRLGVTGRSRTGTSGFTAHGSAIELRPHPNTRIENIGLGGRVRTCDPVRPRHVRFQLRYTEMNWYPRLASNQRPLAYQASALPLSYTRTKKWPPNVASNHGPPG